MTHIWGKLVIGAFVLIFAIVYTVIRVTKNKSQKNRSQKTIDQINSSLNYAQQLADELSEPYGSQLCPENFRFNDLVRTIGNNGFLENYRIDLVHRLSNDKFIIVTTCSDSDFDIQLTGKIGNVNKTYNINFLICFDYNKRQINISSDYERDGHLRGLRHSFARKLTAQVV
jgi:hypothetical protein